MSDPFEILTTAEIRPDAFAGFLTRIAGVLEPGRPDAGRVSREKRHVWIYLNPEPLDPYPDDPHDIEIYDRLSAALGGAPKSKLLLEPSRTPETDKLVIEVAIAFAEQWPAVLWDIDSQILDLAALRRLQRTGAGLPQITPT